MKSVFKAFLSGLGFLLCHTGFRIDFKVEVFVGIHVEEETVHHFIVRLRAGTNDRFRIGVERIEIGIVIKGVRTQT